MSQLEESRLEWVDGAFDSLNDIISRHVEIWLIVSNQTGQKRPKCCSYSTLKKPQRGTLDESFGAWALFEAEGLMLNATP